MKSSTWNVQSIISLLLPIVDTPGFGDTDNDDNNLMNEMVDVLKEKVKTANGFVLLFNGEDERFDSKAQQMLREFEVHFDWFRRISWNEALVIK